MGNSLEVEESLECLRGEASGGSRDLRELVVSQGGVLLLSAGQVDSVDRGKQRIREVLDNGEAMKKFHDMIIRQVSIRRESDSRITISLSICYQNHFHAIRFLIFRCGSISSIRA